MNIPAKSLLLILCMTILCLFTKSAKAYNIISWKLTVKHDVLIQAHEQRIDTTIFLDTLQLSDMDTIKYFRFIDHGDGIAYITRLYLSPNDSTMNLVSEEETSALMRYGHFTMGKLKWICSLYKTDTVTLFFVIKTKKVKMSSLYQRRLLKLN